MLDVKIDEPSDLWFALKNVNSPIPDPGLCPIWGWQMTLCRQHAWRIVLKMIYKNKINRDHIHNRLSSDTQSFHISYSHLWIDYRKAHTINPSRLTMRFFVEGPQQPSDATEGLSLLEYWSWWKSLMTPTAIDSLRLHLHDWGTCS